MSKVVVYSKDNCPSCETLKGKLDLAGIPYEVKNVMQDLDALDFIAGQGHRGVPQLYVDGKHVQKVEEII